MSDMFFAVFILSAFGGLINLLLHSLRKEEYSKLTDSVIGIFLLFVFIRSAAGVEFPSLETFQIPQTNTLESYYSQTQGSILEFTQTVLSEKIKLAFEKEFRILPKECKVYLDNTEFSIQKIIFIFDPSSGIISGFSVQKFIKENYGQEIEVEILERYDTETGVTEVVCTSDFIFTPCYFCTFTKSG